MFDTVYVSSDVASAFELRCGPCGRVSPTDREWQTKSLESCLFSYVLRHDESGAVRLYLLDRPSGKRFWRQWTAEEIAASERDAARGGIFALWLKQPGEGTFLAEAFLPRNRRHRFMGELPHQWVEIYGRCDCGETLERWMKFCDGVVTEIRDTRPKHDDRLFDDASEFGL